MNQNYNLESLKSELKRADHLLYVSLKYTRTVDVIRSVVERLTNAFDQGTTLLLEKVKKRKKKLIIPVAPVKKCELVLELYPEQESLKEFCELYALLREILKSKYTKREEYRRHVTMIAELEPGKTIDIDIDKLVEYFAKIKEFVSLVEELT